MLKNIQTTKMEPQIRVVMILKTKGFQITILQRCKSREIYFLIRLAGDKILPLDIAPMFLSRSLGVSVAALKDAAARVKIDDVGRNLSSMISLKLPKKDWSKNRISNKSSP